MHPCRPDSNVKNHRNSAWHGRRLDRGPDRFLARPP